MNFQDFPADVKLEVFKHISDSIEYGKLCTVCKEWYSLLYESYLWKPIFLRDFGDWYFNEVPERDSSDESDNRVRKSRKVSVSWRDKYIEYYTRGWQWDPRVKYEKIELENNNFTAYLLEGSSYHAIRSSRELKKGFNYFEIFIETMNSEDEKKFDKGEETYLSLGVANHAFDVDRCITGWTAVNDGAGYYNVGSYFVLSVHRPCPLKTKVRSGDYLGFQCDRDELTSKITFYLNGDPITNEITVNFRDPETKYYPYLILANNTKCKVHIVSKFKNFPRRKFTTKQLLTKNVALAKDAYKQKKFAESIFLFDEALKIDKNWKTIWKWKGKAHQRLEQYSEAESCLTKAIDLNNKKPNSYLNRGFLYELLGKSDKGFYHKALEDYNMAIALDPKYSTAYNNRGVVWESLGNTANALTDYEKAIELKPTSAVTYKNRADLYETLNQFDKALSDYSIALLKDPKYPAAYNNRGFLYKRMGKYDMALADYCKAIELDGTDSDHFLNRAFIYEIHGKFAEALDDYAKSIQLNPKNEVAYNNRANLWNNLEKYESCIEDSSKAIELAPRETNSYCHRAFAYYRLGKKDEAWHDLELSLQTNDKYARGFCYRALFTMEEVVRSGVEITLEKMQTVLEDCTRSIELNKEDIPDVYFVRGKALSLLGLWERAISDLEFCLSIQFRGRVFPVDDAIQLLSFCTKCKNKL